MESALPRVQHFEQPVRVRRTTDTNKGLPIARPRSDFQLVVYEKSWGFHDEYGWLPEPGMVLAVPGANGVRVDRQGRVDMTGALAGAARKGGTLIDPEDARLGDPEDPNFFAGGPGFRHYVCTYDTTGGGKHHVEWCAEATKLRSGEVIWNGDDPKCVAEWTRFRRFLRDAGIVPPMQAEVYRWKMATAHDRLERIRTRYAEAPNMQFRVEEEEKRIAAMERAWDDWQGQLASETKAIKPKRGPRQATEEKQA